MRIYIEDNIKDVKGEELDRLVASLPKWRRERAMAYRHEQGRKECAVAYVLLCRALREEYGIFEQPSFVIGEHGKPALAFDASSPLQPCLPHHQSFSSYSPSSHSPSSHSPESYSPELHSPATDASSSCVSGHSFRMPHFNISHCKVAVACVVADVEVGVDVERIGRYNDALARHVLNDEEYGHVVASDNPDLDFTILWTQKEAIVKLTGRGIDDDLKNLLIKYNNVSLTTEVHADKGYVLSVARYL